MLQKIDHCWNPKPHTAKQFISTVLYHKGSVDIDIIIAKTKNALKPF